MRMMGEGDGIRRNLEDVKGTACVNAGLLVDDVAESGL